jgi:uncharacterized delta-60 repeat protein
MFQFKQVAGMIAIHALMLLGAATAWAGRGDVDPNYGEGGHVSAVSAALLALPGDRLVIADAATEDGLRVRMVDATGRNVLDFGERGVVRIASSAAAETFWPEAAALAQNGDMIFVGSLHTGARELLRLDSDGQPVVSFGTRGDGFVELALTTIGAMAFAVDPNGKIFVVEGSSNSDSGCGSPARLQRLLANGKPDAEFGGDSIIEIPNLDLCQGPAVFGARADGSVIIGEGHTIVAVDAAGAIDPTFGVHGRLAVSELPWARGLLLPDGGLLIFGSSDEAASTNDTVFLKFDRNGQPDLNFGAGTGSVTVDLGAELLGDPFAREYVGQLALDPDGEHVVAHLSVSSADGTNACSGIARLSIDGAPDADFGRNGLTCLNVNFALIAVQSDGGPLVIAGYWSDSIYRLLPDNSPSPGFLTVVAPSFESARVDESEGMVTVTIQRVAGRDGAVSANFATFPLRVGYHCGYRDCFTNIAAAGGDYTSTSGRLDWPGGDDSQRTVTVRILDDGIDENTETFGVGFSEPGGGVLLIAENPTIYILDNDAAATPPPTSAPTSPPTPSPTAPGGGGSLSWATQLALLTLLLIGRRPIRCAD